MFSHNNSYSQVKIKCFYFELYIGNGIYRNIPVDLDCPSDSNGNIGLQGWGV